MSKTRNLNLSQQKLLPSSNDSSQSSQNPLLRDSSVISSSEIQFPKLLNNDPEVEEETLMQVEVVNENLLRKSYRAELATKKTCLTRRWQTALVTTIVVLALACGIGGVAYWMTLAKPKVTPYLLYGESCSMNSRSCDPTRMLWCPNDKCACRGDYQWNTTAQNCTCGQYQIWTGVRCQGYGYFGDPCNSIPCRPTLTCAPVINQTYTTGQAVCVCDNETYLDTSGGVTQGQCVPRLGYNSSCKTKFDCQTWLGLSCVGVYPNQKCSCDSTTNWNGSTCVRYAYGWEPCDASVLCETSRGLTCVNNTCQCGSLYYWDNVTTFWCEQKKTYAVTCQYDFQCNATVNLSCPSTVATGCNCPATSYPNMCDCQAGQFWDGQRCTSLHTFNGTCPGQYACTSNLACYLGHCVCPGNMIWNIATPNACNCTNGTIWDVTKSLCI